MFGVTRQAYYQFFWHKEDVSIEESLVLEQVKNIRLRQRNVGTRKLYIMLQNFLLENKIKMGRDALFDLLATHHLLVRKRRRKPITTNSHHWYYKYCNLIKGININKSNQVWVSDITYLRHKNGFLYLSFITDAYSKKIVGYHVDQSLESSGPVEALKMAINNTIIIEGLIHHSDRGIQYCSSQYVKILKEKGIQISMTETGDPRENAVAERVNGIIKELLEDKLIANLEQARIRVKETVEIYNQERLHLSCNLLTPNEAHSTKEPLERAWKTYWKSTKNVIQN